LFEAHPVEGSKAMGTGGLFLRKLRAKVTDRPTGFVWIEKAKLAGSGFPASRSQLKWVRNQGITTLLTLTEEPIPGGWLEGLDLDVHHIPMMDHSPPDKGSLREAANFLRGSIEKEKVVLVHCLAGEGRTGCALAACLMVNERMTAKEAMEHLRIIKPQFVERRQESALNELEEASGLASSNRSAPD